MEEVVENHNENYEIDEDRPTSRITINGHCNKIVFSCSYVHELFVMGHNNYFHGEGQTTIGKITCMGHNNSIRNLMTKRLKILGHNNTCKNVKSPNQMENQG
jgi:hypothetical protein